MLCPVKNASVKSICSLTYRRSICDIMFFRHCLYYDSVNINSYVTLTSCSSGDTRNKLDGTKLRIPHCRTNHEKVSYFVRMLNYVPEINLELSEISEFGAVP